MVRRSVNKTYLMFAVFTISFVLAGNAANTWAQSAQVFLKNDSAFIGMLQVKDEVCASSKEVECENARFVLGSRECSEDPLTITCQAAKARLDNACPCVQARKRVWSGRCEQQPSSQECTEARDMMESSRCLEGFIFEGAVESGAKIPLTICMSVSGYGQISVRDIKKGLVWKRYHLINNGDTLGYP